MEQTKNGKKYATVAAVCLAIPALFYFLPDFQYFFRTNFFMPVVKIAFAVTLFMRKKPIATACSAIIALIYIFPLIINTYFNMSNFAGFLTYAALLMMLILSLNGNPLVNKVWFLAGALDIFLYFCLWEKQGYFYEDYAILYMDIFDYLFILVSLIDIAALFFAGLWAKQSMATVRKNVIKEYISSHRRDDAPAKRQTDTVGGADRLKVYKDLLDTGAITQEEFDERKRQILHSDE